MANTTTRGRTSRSQRGGRRSTGVYVSRFWRRSFASDYAGFALILTAFALIQVFVEPFHRMFSLSDLSISFPHAEVERVPLVLNFVYALFVPLSVLLALNLLTSARPHKHHLSVLGLAVSLALAALLTDIVKNTAGRPRPDLLARCKPRPDAPAVALVYWADVCTEMQHHLLHDGWRSFPSGHASFAFAGLGYLSLWLAGQTRLFARVVEEEEEENEDENGDDNINLLVRGDLLRALLCLAPLVGAALIAISRCQDYRHDVYDVCAGSLLGYVVAHWSYRRYWPRLSSLRCDEPYKGPPGKSVGEGGARYGRVGDLEEGGGAAGSSGGVGGANVGRLSVVELNDLR